MPEKPDSDTANEANKPDASADKANKPSSSDQAKADEPDKAQKASASDKAEATKSKDDSEPESDKAQKSDASDKEEAKSKSNNKAEATKSKSKDDSETEIVEAGKISRWLTENGFEHESLGVDHQGVEILKVDRELLVPFATALYAYGFNYLQCQGGYDVGPGDDLVSFYNLTKMSDNADRPEEVRVKVFLPREDPRVSTVYWIWKTADWQERETYDMYGIIYEGHPNLKRLLMPEDWVGWPLRKDYISPDFYELQDAY